VHGDCGRECVRDVVVAEQMELVTLDQWLTPKPEHPGLRVVPAIRRFGEGEQHFPPRDAARQLEHQPIIRIEHPDVVRGGVAKQQPLVGVVRLRRGIAVQMVGGEVRQHADFGREVGAVVQLKRRHLEAEPLIPLVGHREVRHRPADVPRRRGL